MLEMHFTIRCMQSTQCAACQQCFAWAARAKEVKCISSIGGAQGISIANVKQERCRSHTCVFDVCTCTVTVLLTITFASATHLYRVFPNGAAMSRPLVDLFKNVHVEQTGAVLQDPPALARGTKPNYPIVDRVEDASTSGRVQKPPII